MDRSCTLHNFVSLKVYDVTGKEIATLVNQKQNEGSYSVDFNAGNFSREYIITKFPLPENLLIPKKPEKCC